MRTLPVDSSPGRTATPRRRDSTSRSLPARTSRVLRLLLVLTCATAFVGLFSAEYRSEQPAHPSRAFHGADQVRENWAAVFAGVPDQRRIVRDELRQYRDHEDDALRVRHVGQKADQPPHGLCLADHT